MEYSSTKSEEVRHDFIGNCQIEIDQELLLAYQLKQMEDELEKHNTVHKQVMHK